MYNSTVSKMPTFGSTMPISSEEDDDDSSGWFEVDEETRIIPSNNAFLFVNLQKLYEVVQPITGPAIMILGDPYLESLAEANLARVKERMFQVDEVMEMEIADAARNGVKFNRTRPRDRYQNDEIVKDCWVLIKWKRFPKMQETDQILIIQWYRLGRNWWGHDAKVNALVCVRQFYTAMIELTGPNVLNVPDLQQSLKDELMMSNMTSVSLQELRQTVQPKP